MLFEAVQAFLDEADRPKPVGPGREK